MSVLSLRMTAAAKRSGNDSPEGLLASNEDSYARFHLGLTGMCANPGCRSGWLHLFRNRTRPVFEGGWTCSNVCTEQRMRVAVRREAENWAPVQEPYRHRIPLGLLMLEKGWITAAQLRRAVEAQKRTGKLRIGEWLVRQGAADEASVSRALSMQWGCPVLQLGDGRATLEAGVIPRLFVEAFRALPLRTASDKLLYLGFEERKDAILALAVERMTGARVESGIVHSSDFWSASARAISDGFPPVQFVEAVSESAAAHVMARSIERVQPVNSRLVRVRNWLWLRMFPKPEKSIDPKITSVSDVICTIGAINSSSVLLCR